MVYELKTIVFIGSNKFGTSKEALTIAKDMGYFVVLLTNRMLHKEFLEVDQIVYLENLVDEEHIKEKITNLIESGKQICACISFVDPYVSFAAKIAMYFGLAEISVEALNIMENKIKIREKLNNLPITPLYAVFQSDDCQEGFIKKDHIIFPFIIKLPISNGSKDVFYIDTLKRFENAVSILNRKLPNSPLLIEEYLPGAQYIVEVLVYKTMCSIVGVIEQEVAYDRKFIVTGYKFPALLDETVYKKLTESVSSIVEEIGLISGSCHLEMKLVQSQWKLIEVNPRMSGGAMNRILEEGTGINLVKEIIKLYLGEEPILKETRKQFVYARYVIVGSQGRLVKVLGYDQAWLHEGVKYVHIKPVKGDILSSPYSMGNRYACVVATSETAEQAKKNALVAAKEIKFFLIPL